MNQYQNNIYDNLMTLCAANEAFYFHDFEKLGQHFRIFNYRLASYTDFLLPSALECRGIMFELDVMTKAPVRLAAHPMPKFFNLNENPMTMNLDLSTVVKVEDKADGSLMSSYTIRGQVYLKSKGSLASEQAVDAMAYLNKPEQDELKADLQYLSNLNWTVNLEWCSDRMDHRIVIGHQQSHLLLLNVRHNETGEMLDIRSQEFRHQYPMLSAITVGIDNELDDPVAFVNNIPNMKGIEGYIVTLADGLVVKVKTEWYLTQHRAKDSINSDRRLFEAVIEESVDDLRSLFAGDPLVISRIDAMQEKVGTLYNHVVATVETFYEQNKELSRKDYAIKGQQELGMFFNLAMMKFIGKEINFKEYIKGKWKELGIKETVNNE